MTTTKSATPLLYPRVHPALHLPYGGDVGLTWDPPRDLSERRKARASRSLYRILTRHPDHLKRYVEAQRGIQKPKPKVQILIASPPIARPSRFIAGFDAGSPPGLLSDLTLLDVSEPSKPRLVQPAPRVLTTAELRALSKTARCVDCDHRARDHVADGCTAEDEEGGVCVCKTSKADVIRKAEDAAIAREVA